MHDLTFDLFCLHYYDGSDISPENQKHTQKGTTKANKQN